MAVNPATGKTHTRYLRFLAGGYDLSGDMRTISEFGMMFAQADATGWSNSTRQWLTGWAEARLGGVSAIFSNISTGTGPVAAGSPASLPHSRCEPVFPRQPHKARRA